MDHLIQNVTMMNLGQRDIYKVYTTDTKKEKKMKRPERRTSMKIMIIGFVFGQENGRKMSDLIE